MAFSSFRVHLELKWPTLNGRFFIQNWEISSMPTQNGILFILSWVKLHATHYQIDIFAKRLTDFDYFNQGVSSYNIIRSWWYYQGYAQVGWWRALLDFSGLCLISWAKFQFSRDRCHFQAFFISTLNDRNTFRVEFFQL